MSDHDAEYFRQRRCAQEIPERETLSAKKYSKRGLELKGLEQLPWPKDLFGNYASIAELMAEAAELSGPGECRDDLCSCGRRREHRNNVSQTIRSPYGHSFNVVYFWSNACKSKWNRDGMGQDRGFPSIQAKKANLVIHKVTAVGRPAFEPSVGRRNPLAIRGGKP
jgi:hypothetical protein